MTTTICAHKDSILHFWIDVTASDNDTLDLHQMVNIFRVQVSHSVGGLKVDDAYLDQVKDCPVELFLHNLVRHLIEQRNDLTWEVDQLIVEELLVLENMFSIDEETIGFLLQTLV